MTITVGGNAARVQSDGSAHARRADHHRRDQRWNLYLQGASNGVVSGEISDNAVNSAGKINLTK